MSFDTAVSLAGAIGECFVIGLLLYRKVWRVLPFFTAYVVWTLGTDFSSSYILATHPDKYFTYYLVQLSIDSLLIFAVLVELAWSVLRPMRASLPKATVYVIAVLVAISAAVIWPLVGQTVPPGFGPQSALLYHLQVAPATLRVGFFLVLASLSQLLSLGWRDRELQIATGIGFYSIVSLIVAVLHSHTSTSEQYHWLDLATSISYIGTDLYWVLSFSAKEQERKQFSPQMQELLLQLGGGGRNRPSGPR